MKKLVKKVGLTLNKMMGFSPKNPSGRYPNSNLKDYILDGQQQLNAAKIDYKAANEKNDYEAGQQEISQAYKSTITASLIWAIVCAFFVFKTNFESGGWLHTTGGSIIICGTLVYSLLTIYQASLLHSKIKNGGVK